MAINFVSCCCAGKHILGYSGVKTTFLAFCAFLSELNRFLKLTQMSGQIFIEAAVKEKPCKVVIPSLCKSGDQDIYFFTDSPFFLLFFHPFFFASFCFSSPTKP